MAIRTTKTERKDIEDAKGASVKAAGTKATKKTPEHMDAEIMVNGYYSPLCCVCLIFRLHYCHPRVIKSNENPENNPIVSKRKGEDSKTDAIHFPRPGRESSAADTEDIVIDEDRFMTL
jgi:hypothetical protein